jgi:UDP-GlcNAc:undecaprenyl-phosphate GlcNAc-1-phosphate transferase
MSAVVNPFFLALAKPFLLALVLSLALVPVCRLLALRLGRVAHPRADRWHQSPVALLGGVAISLSLFAGTAVFGVLGDAPVLVICAALVFLVGLVDDLVRLKPATKLIAEIALGSALLFFDYRVHWVNSVTLDMLLTLVWVVGMTNAFNLLDNMDGLCAGIALIVGAALLIDLLPGSSGQAFASARYLSLLLGATAGFLVYNLYPASIFMGDSGSLLIGFSFAAVTLSVGDAGPGRDVLSIVAAPVLVLMIPIFDTTFVTVSRSCRAARPPRRPRPFVASTGGHRPVGRRAVAVLWLLAAIRRRDRDRGQYEPELGRAGSVFFLVAMALFAAYSPASGLRRVRRACAGAA